MRGPYACSRCVYRTVPSKRDKETFRPLTMTYESDKILAWNDPTTKKKRTEPSKEDKKCTSDVSSKHFVRDHDQNVYYEGRRRFTRQRPIFRQTATTSTTTIITTVSTAVGRNTLCIPLEKLKGQKLTLGKALIHLSVLEYAPAHPRWTTKTVMAPRSMASSVVVAVVREAVRWSFRC